MALNIHGDIGAYLYQAARKEKMRNVALQPYGNDVRR